MSVLNKISNDFKRKLEKTLKYKNDIDGYNYYYPDIDLDIDNIDLDIDLFELNFKFDKKNKDFFYMLAKLKPRIYYEHSKHRLKESGFDTTVVMCWPDLRLIRPPMSVLRIHFAMLAVLFLLALEYHLTKVTNLLVFIKMLN